MHQEGQWSISAVDDLRPVAQSVLSWCGSATVIFQYSELCCVVSLRPQSPLVTCTIHMASPSSDHATPAARCICSRDMRRDNKLHACHTLGNTLKQHQVRRALTYRYICSSQLARKFFLIPAECHLDRSGHQVAQSLPDYRQSPSDSVTASLRSSECYKVFLDVRSSLRHKDQICLGTPLLASTHLYPTSNCGRSRCGACSLHSAVYGDSSNAHLVDKIRKCNKPAKCETTPHTRSAIILPLQHRPRSTTVISKHKKPHKNASRFIRKHSHSQYQMAPPESQYQTPPPLSHPPLNNAHMANLHTSPDPQTSLLKCRDHCIRRRRPGRWWCTRMMVGTRFRGRARARRGV
jgi:hypothetical protein